jgi:hypothetical protein
MVIVGDVVRAGSTKWVVMKREGGMVRLVRYERGKVATRFASARSLEVIEHPVFKDGEKVLTSALQRGTVVADHGGESKIRVKGPNRLPIRSGGYVTGFSGGQHDADRWQPF